MVGRQEKGRCVEPSLRSRWLLVVDLTLPLTSCATLGRLLHLPENEFPHLDNEKTLSSLRDWTLESNDIIWKGHCA